MYVLSRKKNYLQPCTCCSVEAVLILFMQECELLCDGYGAYKGLAAKLRIYVNPSFLHQKFWTE